MENHPVVSLQLETAQMLMFGSTMGGTTQLRVPAFIIHSYILPLDTIGIPLRCYEILTPLLTLQCRWANPELTPVAIRAGKLLATRLFGGKCLGSKAQHPAMLFQ